MTMKWKYKCDKICSSRNDNEWRVAVKLFSISKNLKIGRIAKHLTSRTLYVDRTFFVNDPVHQIGT